MKKIIFFLVLLLTSTCIINAKVIKGECGRRLTWEFDTKTGVLSFAGPGIMYDYSDRTPWAAYAKQIKTLLLNRDVKDVPYYALNGCLFIEKIIVDNSNYFFTEGNCLITKKDSALVYAGKDFTIPSSVRVIGNKSFYEHPSLVSMNIPDGVVTISDQAFAKCTALKAVSIPSTVRNISRGAFFECRSLTSVNMAEGVVFIGEQSFAKCSSLSEINIPSTVNTIDVGAFARCSELKSVIIPSSVRVINGGAFQNCTSLASLKIEEGVRYIGIYAFQNCTSLASVLIPSTVDEIKNNAFAGCRIYDLKVAELNQTYYSSDNQIYQKEFEEIKEIPQEVKTKYAQFPGGDSECSKWIKSNVIYPRACIDDSIQGSVFVKFTVEADSTITNIEVVNDANELLSAEVIRAIKIMPKWEPAEYGSQRVSSSANLQIFFGYGDDDFYVTQVLDDRIFDVVEEIASFPGGDSECMNWLRNNIRYPEKAEVKGVQGRVIVSFIVNRDGSIVDVKVVRSPDELLSNEAVRVVKLMPKWKPARLNNKTVRSRLNLPIMFRLGF